MKPRYVLSPEAAILDRIAFLASHPDAGHWRRDLTDASVKFFPVYSYLIVYRHGTEPVQLVSILHGHRNLGHILENR
jgi:antitoxin ParD1/3/4